MTKNSPNKKLTRAVNWPISLAILLCFFILSTAHGYAQRMNKDHKQWLKTQFSKQHQKLIPIVAVADMYFACNGVRKVDAISPPLQDLVLNQTKKQLASKLMRCLGDDEIKSDQALNFGLLGCFHQQLSGLAEEEKKIKMALVNKAILSLSREERHQSFTRCVNAQAINYLK
jgi:hypothetical protein